MTEKQFAYVLEKYPFYEGYEILMISSSIDEITTHFIRELRQLPNHYGLQISKYEFGRLYGGLDYVETIKHIERENGKIKDLKKELEE